MKRPRAGTTTGFIAIGLIACLLFTPPVGAESPGRDAGKHFARGVELYNDGDFRGALVEFKRAYALLPRAPVLYDIGETEYQLQDYARALATFKRFLAETGPNAAHRAEVEATLETLRGRVGRLGLATDVAGCEVSIDDQPAGTTPIAQPITVSVGTRRVAVSCGGNPPVTRVVEVAAGELARLELRLPSAPAPAALGASLGQHAASAPAHASPAERQRRGRLQLALTWTASALLLGGTIGLGSSALLASSRLDELRKQYPVEPSALTKQANLSRALGIATDVAGIAALAVIAASAYVTVRERRSSRLQLAVMPGGAALAGVF